MSCEESLPHATPTDKEDLRFYQEDKDLSLTSNELDSPYANEAQPLEFTSDHRLRSNIGVYPKHRKPSWEDCRKFVLYHGSQKLYEATFIQRFLAHALHPDRLHACLSNDPGGGGSAHQYLIAVMDNVNNLFQKMIHNTQSRIVKFVTDNDNETAPFWDCNQFDDHIFAGFSPGYRYSVVNSMCQSWHRAFDIPSMVQITKSQITVGGNISPFEEIDAVTGTSMIFRTVNRADTTSNNQSKHAVRGGAQIRGTEHASIKVPEYSHDSGPRLQESGQVSFSNRTPALIGSKSWRTRLINDHKRLLIERWPESHRSCDDTFDLSTYVEWAIAQGHLKPLVHKHREVMDSAVQRGDPTEVDKTPPLAYLEEKYHDEQPAWQCGITHCMGIYYNAGDRKNCVGCFTSFNKNDNPKRKIMGFYLPSRSYWFNFAPHLPWNVSKPLQKIRNCSRMSHNSIAKDAYWHAVDNGATNDQARRSGVEAVEAHLLAVAQKKEKKKLKPKPKPDFIDFGVHPSGSVTMEHGQTLPIEASFEKLPGQRYEENAWRCDINHALGRYYMAGDVKSCPGCGSCRNGPGRQGQMDFYLPAGTVVRQKASNLVKWKPRKAYNLAKKGRRNKQCVKHNQITSKEYWRLVAQGYKHVEGSYDAETLALAVEVTEKHIDAKMKAAYAKAEAVSHTYEQESVDRAQGKRQQKEHPETGGQRLGLLSDQRDARLDDSESSESNEVNEYETGQGDEDPCGVSSSSDDDVMYTSDEQ